MAYDPLIAEQIRVYFLDKHIEFREVKMMGGLCIMVDEKMCVGVMGDTLMARIDPTIYDKLLEKKGCNEMKFTGRSLIGYVLVDLDEVATDKGLGYWVDLCLEFNPKAKASKKKAKK